jgi:hypothetical protein
MERTDSTDTARREPMSDLEAIRYYSDLEIATEAFAAKDQSGKNTSRGMFGLPGITNWSVWTARWPL